jgi:ribosomal protein L37E
MPKRTEGKHEWQMMRDRPTLDECRNCGKLRNFYTEYGPCPASGHGISEHQMAQGEALKDQMEDR